MIRCVALVLVGAALLAVGAAARTSVVTHGTITPNLGAVGISLGMTRAQIVERLGRPVTSSGADLEYGPDPPHDGIGLGFILDGNAKNARVRRITISGAGFCVVRGGPCLFAKGGFGKLVARYRGALKVVRYEDGEHVYRLTARYHGCAVFTDFAPLLSASLKPSQPIGPVSIGFFSGHPC